MYILSIISTMTIHEHIYSLKINIKIMNSCIYVAYLGEYVNVSSYLVLTSLAWILSIIQTVFIEEYNQVSLFNTVSCTYKV